MGVKLVLGMISTIIVIGLISVYYFMPFNELEFSANPLDYNFTSNGNITKMQFYHNLRFKENQLSYKMFNCNIKKQEDMRTAFDIIENLTILEFNPILENEDITVTCDEKVKFNEGMFIAGEGGPTQIVRAGKYNIILHGSILLIKSSDCERPNVAVHELLHVLGFVHSNNPNNIMYNYTKCKQTIGDEIPDLINELYSVPSLPDLAFENASAYMKGKYLELSFSIRNIGLKEADVSKIIIKMDDNVLKELELKKLDSGEGSIINIENLGVKPSELGDLKLFVDYSGEELDKNNNEISLSVV